MDLETVGLLCARYTGGVRNLLSFKFHFISLGLCPSFKMRESWFFFDWRRGRDTHARITKEGRKRMLGTGGWISWRVFRGMESSCEQGRPIWQLVTGNGSLVAVPL